MKAVIKILVILSAGFLVMLLVNLLSPSPIYKYVPERCTRYCEQHGCPHLGVRYPDTEKELFSKWWFKLYRYNVKVLSNIPLLDYHEANILVYFIFYPIIIAALLWRLFKE